MNPQSWNRFAYTSNNPINRIDPTGHDDTCDLFPDGHPESCECLNDPYCNMSSSDILILISSFLVIHGGFSVEQMAEITLELYYILSNASSEFIRKFIVGKKFHVYNKNEWWIAAVTKDSACGHYGTWYGASINTDCNMTSQTINHEFWHWIDYQTGTELSKDFEDYVGASTTLTCFGGYCKTTYDKGPQDAPLYGKVPPPNRREDFAESGEEYFGHETEIDPAEKRWEFFDYLLKFGEAPPTP